VVTELGGHFQPGRLDRAEFDERVTKALCARTGRDLGGLLADLPPAREDSSAPQPGTRPPGTLILVPLLAAAILIAGIAAGGAHHLWVAWPLWWLIPIMVLRFSWWRRNCGDGSGSDPCPQKRRRSGAGRVHGRTATCIPPGPRLGPDPASNHVVNRSISWRSRCVAKQGLLAGGWETR
jgi:hypothetical protein